ncbi:hypothetical protein RF55_16036 [Lasius niger]|uniref:Uncharacterized protein n=1 Tax=Lasius niger TaxID=67767 RepID=A0A0J7MYC5_LASNI|nr:hypothetical protein RF55_16036 [Lasius niger]
MDYGLFVYYPRTHKGKERIEKLQYKGIRIAMGYRNSTPTNVMLMEVRIMRMEERAGFLARRYWTKIYGCKNKEMEESWRQTKKYKEEIDQADGFIVHNKDYWVLTKLNLVNLEIAEAIGVQKAIGYVQENNIKTDVGNEVADMLAKEATEEEQDDRNKVPIRDWSRVYREEMERKGAWFSKLDEPRGLITMINRLRANHYNLNESLARKGYIQEARCNCGPEVQDIHHVIFRCVRFDTNRSKLYRRLEKMEIEYPYDIENWLSKVNIEPLRATWTFLREINKII